MYGTIQQLVKLMPLLIGATVLVGMLIIFNSDNPAIHDELVSLSLLPQPEKLTELYFAASEKLPKYVVGNDTIRFAFVVHNLEVADHHYAYNVQVRSLDKKRVVDSGSIFVKDSQYYVKNEQFSLDQAEKVQEVVVELADKGQSIDLWIGK